MEESTTSQTVPSPAIAPRHFEGLWSRIGGGSLMIAALFHVALLVAGAFWILQIVREPEKKVNFLPPGGGNGGDGAAQHQIQQKRQAQITPTTNLKRVFAEGAQSDFTIPEQGDNFGEMSTLSSLSGGGGSGGLGNGLGGFGGGKGTGNGNGIGSGLGGGGTLGIKLFGMDLKVKSIGVVMDVSGSMTPHLKRVLDEVNTVAKGSPLILHVGCGIGEDRSRPRIEPVDAPFDGFKRFWYLHHDPLYREQQKNRKAKIDFSRPIPSPEVYQLLASRPQTFFHVYDATRTTGEALLAPAFKNVEAIYWFADFQDPIDPDEAKKILQGLSRRKQKLFVHASANGSFLSNALTLMAQPTGGEQVKSTER